MYRCQCMFDFSKLENGMMFGVEFSSVILEKNDWRCLWDVWILEVQSPQWKAALIAMALFLEAWQHVVQWYWWMSVLLCIARFIQPMKCWSASPLLPDPWCVLHHARKVGLYWNLLSCVVALQPEEYCYFVKGGQTAREESALGRPHGMVLQTMPHYRCDVHSSASGFIHLDFDDLTWCYYVICYWCFIQRPFWLPKDLLNLCVCATLESNPEILFLSRHPTPRAIDVERRWRNDNWTMCCSGLHEKDLKEQFYQRSMFLISKLPVKHT